MLRNFRQFQHKKVASVSRQPLITVKGKGSRFSACSFIKMLFCCRDLLYRLYRHNVVKEPLCTLPRQSLALDQLKYLQIAVN